MRVLAIGDTHLRSTSRRNALRLRALDQIVAAADLQTPDLIVWPGDLFDTRSTVEDRNTLLAYLFKLATYARVLIVRGNHDAPGDLDIFGALDTTHAVTVVTEPGVHEFHTPGGSIAVACLPYPEEAGLAALGYAPADVPDAAAAALDTIFLKFAAELAEAQADGCSTMFIGHANVVGAVASTGQPLVGAEIALRPEHLDRLGNIPKVLNHIHAAQDVHGAIYVGSIAPQDWGEVEYKRFLTLEHQQGGEWWITNHPLDLPRLYHVEGVLARNGFSWVVKRGPEGDVLTAPASWNGHEVRVRYRFQASEAALLAQAEAHILAEFAEAAHLEIEPVAVPDRAVRAPEVAAAATTADKLRAYCALSGVDVADSVLAKLLALETQDAAVLLAQLEQRLRAITDRESEVAA